MKIPVGVEAAAGETPSLTGELLAETHIGLEHTQTHPLWNQDQKGPIRLWVAEGVTENQQRVEQVPLLPLGLLPHIHCHSAATSVTHPGEYLRLRPFM